MTAALQNLIAHHQAFAENTSEWWLTPSEAARLTGWPRYRIHRLMKSGKLETRRLAITSQPAIVRLRARDLIHHITLDATRDLHDPQRSPPSAA